MKRMTRNRHRWSPFIVVIVLMAASLLWACGSSGPASRSAVGTASVATGATAAATNVVVVEGGSYTNVGPSQLDTMLRSKDFTLVNVHVPYEGEIASTDAFIPYDQIDARIAELPADTGAKIVVYCRTGRMSDIAARALVTRGYTNIWNLDGGMVAWEAAGLPLRQSGG